MIETILLYAIAISTYVFIGSKVVSLLNSMGDNLFEMLQTNGIGQTGQNIVAIFVTLTWPIWFGIFAHTEVKHRIFG